MPRSATDASASSSTWSPISTSWSTSEPRTRGRAERLTAYGRLVHPFPILVDAAATGAIALVAGASPLVAMRLAASMLGIQAAIGALNDVVDAPRDAGRKPGKPIPAGLVSPGAGMGVAAVAALAGLALAAPSGLPTLVVGVVILAIGAAYDLRLKGTPWSWLPFAAGIPLLPVFAWLGTGEGLPAAFVVLVPAAGLAGAGLAIANALVDVERDRAAGVTSIAAHLGPVAAWRAMAGLQGAVVVLALATALGVAADARLVVAVVPGMALLLAGTVLSAAADPGRREVGWRLQAIGVALLAAGWLPIVGLGQGSAA